MFFKTKRNRRKSTRQTLGTEQLEPKAMFSVSPVEPVVALDVGPVNQAGYSCENAGTCSDPIWTNGGASTLRIAGTTGPETATSLRSENRFVFEIPKNDSGITLHASANPHAGPEGFMKLGDIKGEFQLTQPLTGSAGSVGSTSLRSENRFVFEAPKNDGLLVPAGYDFASFGLEANERVGGVGKGTFTPVANANGTATLSTQVEDSRMIVHPQFNVGDGGRMIIHPQFNVGDDGRMIIHPQFNVGDDGRSIVHPQFNVGKATFTTGAGGDSIVHPQFNGGEDGHSIVHPQFCTVQPQVENVSMYDHIQAPRSQAFARMGR